MHTLLISEFFPPRVGGTPTWFYQVYRRYPPGEATVLTDCQPGDEAFDERLALPVRRVLMRMDDWGFFQRRSARQYLRLALVAWRLVRAQRIRMVHCARVITEGVIGVLLRRLGGVPYCIYAHGEEIGTARSSRQLGFLMRRAYGAAHRIIANSENTRSLLREVGVPDSKIVVIHPGVDVECFRPGDNEVLIRQRLGLNGHKVLLSVGRLQRRKGHDRVEEANQDIEGFGIVFLEANACGKPVIGGKSGGTGEAIVEGETGLRVDGESPQAIAEAVLSLLCDRERALEMGRKGRARAVQQFGWDRIADKTRQLR